MTTKLYNHQQKLIDANPERLLLCWDTGTGKSLAAVSWADLNEQSTLIIVPKALKEKWERDIIGRTNWKIVSKEEFRRDYKKLGEFKNLIVDEAHYFSGMTSQLSKALHAYIKAYDPRRLLLTATPYMSTPWNIYVLARHLGHNWNYIEFKQRFFYDRYIGRRVVPAIKPGIEDDIAKLVKKIASVVKLDECVDVPEQVFETEMFKETITQKAARQLVTDINPIVRYTKYHEIENGMLKGDGYEPDMTFLCDKNDRISELCEATKKVAIICRYNNQIDIIHDHLRKNHLLKTRPIYIINGATENKDKIVRLIEEDESCIVIINASCSEGYELPSVGVVVFVSLSFSYKDYKQMCGRFLRINRLKKNVYIHLVTAGGIDEEVYKSMMRKQDFDIKIFAQEHDGEPGEGNQ